MTTEYWSSNSGVLSLLDRSMHCVIKDLSQNEDQLNCLPINVKSKFLNLLCKRGLISDGNIGQLFHNGVRVLDLSECDVSDTALRVISRKGSNLAKIDLNSAKESRTSITPQGISDLATGCKRLQIVYLRRCLLLTDEGVLALATACPQLRDLNIGGCPLVTDVSLAELGQKCRFLRCINFSKAAVTDNGVLALVSGACANSLKEVHMNGCMEVTDDAVEAVLQFCPNISILLFHGCPKLTERSRLALEELSGSNSKMKQVTWTVY